MSMELHVYTGGIDPFRFFAGDILVYVHTSLPAGTELPAVSREPKSNSDGIYISPELKPPYEAAIVAMPGDADELGSVIDERAAPGEELQLILKRSGVADDLIQLETLISGMTQASAGDVSLHLVEETGDSGA